MSLAEEQLLPDLVLLEVMQYLSVDDVFACRLVCKRLEALARHPNVWRHRRIDWDRDCPCAVLRLAPCLRAIVCRRHGDGYSPYYSNAAFETTKCAVTSLDIEVESAWNGKKSHPQLAHFTQVVRNQIALGRLQHVTVLSGRPGMYLRRQADPLRGVDAFWDALAQSSCLQSLRFLGCVPSATQPLQSGSSKSSLLLFKCRLTRKSESFVKAVLAAHTDTLEEVSLRGSLYVDDSAVSSSDTTELLARMPRLRRLKYDRLSPIDALAACNTLKDVSLFPAPGCSPLSLEQPQSNILKFLSEANQLRALSILFGPGDNIEELIEATLVSSALSLEHLSLRGYKAKEVHQVLIRALPRLPALRQLTLHPGDLEECDELLLAITPLSAPALRRLKLISDEDAYNSGYGCGHHWLHGDAVRATLVVNPLLHIHLWNPNACCSDFECDPCATLCHLEAGWNFPGRLVLFAHEPGKCPAPEDHTAGGRKWRSIHMPCNRLQ
ncbi:uncharacterized protein LOC113204773 [Frankliniella occidentalis]|uniref:Uncharacterized protein LOC113204773 n=1 Tax=Frankliniella occidentalis TaxID=133901 RepID=A0A6J1S4C1_FRAOC|nr:uncharacterized protein LOC113204773 [Frankliniella occidentalis]